MKRLKYLTVMLAALVLCIASCKKGDDGAAGPSGANGATGATGAQGPVGPAGPKGADGKDGSIIYSGNTTPLAATGVAGDFYLNTATGLLYGPKTAAGWGSGFSLKGPAGATGASGATGATGAAGVNGNTTLSGSGAPSASLGKVGDFYLDKASYFLYGPKTGTGWGPAVNLHGPAGPAGPTGPAGTANVIYSGWNYATNFRDTIIDGSKLKVADLAAPSLTTSILNGGSMMIYFTYGSVIQALPYTSNAGGMQSTLSYIPRLGLFTITRFTADNSGSVSLSSGLQYRYVIIPGGISVATAKHVNINDYESVRKFYMLGN